MFYLVDFDKNSFGKGHPKVEDAVKEYEKAIKGTNYCYGVVEFVFVTDPNGNGLPKYVQTRRVIKLPPLPVKTDDVS